MYVDTFNEEEKNLNKVEKLDGKIWITYADSIGHSYAIDNLISADKILMNKEEKQYKFMIFGSEPLKDKAKILAKTFGCNNVEFLGYVTYPLMVAYLVKSHILINSFAKGAS